MHRNDEVKAQIEQLNSAFMADIRAKNAASLAQRYTEEGQFIQAGGPPVTGRAGLEAMFAGMLASGVEALAITTDTVEADGETAWEDGGYELTAADGTVIDFGRYIVIWKNAGAGWQMHRDIITSTKPAG
mgnify:CR=1 FL=1